MMANTVSWYLYRLTVNNQYLGITVWTVYCPLLVLDDKRRVYNSIQLPHIFLGSPGACRYSVHIGPFSSSPPLEGSGKEGRSNDTCRTMDVWLES